MAGTEESARATWDDLQLVATVRPADLRRALDGPQDATVEIPIGFVWRWPGPSTAPVDPELL